MRPQDTCAIYQMASAMHARSAIPPGDRLAGLLFTQQADAQGDQYVPRKLGNLGGSPFDVALRSIRQQCPSLPDLIRDMAAAAQTPAGSTAP